MNAIEVKKNPSQEELRTSGVFQWPVWEKEVSDFPWHYDEKETCYILEGSILVTPEDGEPVQIERGDLVIFPAGMSCRWDILRPVRKHYNFG